MLVNKRLDLDIAKTRVRKAHEADREGRVSYSISTFAFFHHTAHKISSHSAVLLPLCQNLNANPLEDDYLSHVSYMFSFLRVKWLKVSDEH